MKVSQWLQKVERAGLDPLDAELILLHLLGATDRTYIALHFDDVLSPEIVKAANKLVKRRFKSEPLAFILGYRDFYGRRFAVMNGDVKTLIPRPESEVIVDLAKEIAPSTILDVGTGSGVLALTMAAEMPQASVVATDIYPEYFSIVKKNAQNLGLSAVTLSEVGYAPSSAPTPVWFGVSDLLDGINARFDLIVANLPYVDGKWDWLDKKALSYEPYSSLFAEDDGLALIKKLIVQVREKAAASYLIIEADPCQFEEIIHFAMQCGLILLTERGFQLLFRVG